MAPSARCVGTALPKGSLRTTLLTAMGWLPARARDATSKNASATTPSAMVFWFSPAMRTRTLPDERGLEKTSLEAAFAAGPVATSCNPSALASKTRSNWRPPTSSPGLRASVTGKRTRRSPGAASWAPTVVVAAKPAPPSARACSAKAAAMYLRLLPSIIHHSPVAGRAGREGRASLRAARAVLPHGRAYRVLLGPASTNRLAARSAARARAPAARGHSPLGERGA